MKLELGKSYLTRDGRTAKITGHKFQGVIDESTYRWSDSGESYPGRGTDLDLVAEVPEPEQAPQLTFEPGRYYRTRGGDKAVVYATHADLLAIKYPLHGAILSDDDWEVAMWRGDGRSFTAEEHQSDLVAPWVESPAKEYGCGFYRLRDGTLGVVTEIVRHLDFPLRGYYIGELGFLTETAWDLSGAWKEEDTHPKDLTGEPLLKLRTPF